LPLDDVPDPIPGREHCDKELDDPESEDDTWYSLDHARPRGAAVPSKYP